jgi:hypothetical protein
MNVFPVRSASRPQASILVLSVAALFLGGAPTVFSQDRLPAADPSQPWHRHSSDPRFQSGYLFWFSLDESPAQIIEKLGQPAQVGEMGRDFLIWQFQISMLDRHEFSHVICIRRSDNKIVSIARNYEFEENVDGLFPPKMTEVHQWMKDGKPQFGVRLRRLSNGRLLLAMGSEKPGKKTSQILLIRESELPIFMPWLQESLKSAAN